MITDLKETAFPSVYASFTDLFQGHKPWLNTVEKQALQIKANPYSQPQIHREYRVAYGLAAFDSGGLEAVDPAELANVQHAMSFAAQVCEILDQVTDEAAKQSYIGRISGAFNNPAEMRAIRFEHLTALALSRQGGQIEWPETKNGTERFDILATDGKGNTLEVECKSCSPDKGRAITQHEASQFFHRLLERLEAIIKHGEVMMIKIRVPKRLPTSDTDLSIFAGEILDAIENGRLATEKGTLISFHHYISPLVTTPDIPTELVRAEIYAHASRQFNGIEGHRIVKHSPSMSTGLCVDVCSGRSPGFFKAAWDTAKHAVQNQMTKTRPGCLVLRLEGMDKQALEHFAQETPNSLAWFASKVLRDERHQHLACVAFVSDETVEVTSSDSKTPLSSTYVFEREKGQSTIALQLLGQDPERGHDR